jgi:hypothetical protein
MTSIEKEGRTEGFLEISVSVFFPAFVTQSSSYFFYEVFVCF